MDADASSDPTNSFPDVEPLSSSGNDFDGLQELFVSSEVLVAHTEVPNYGSGWETPRHDGARREGPQREKQTELAEGRRFTWIAWYLLDYLDKHDLCRRIAPR